MLKTERQEKILEILQNCKHSTTDKLREQLFASYSSVRRDLEELENMGHIRRSYGRVELAGRNPLLVSYPIRINKNAEQKELLQAKRRGLSERAIHCLLTHPQAAHFSRVKFCI